MLATSYGSSMEPMVHRGDVLILRKGGPARVGDVVGYRSELLNRVVVHRVKGIENGKLVLKGDNNDFLDPERVPQSAVVGHLALHVPEAGIALEELRKPRSAAALGILAAFFIAGGSRKRRRRNPDEMPAEGRAPATALLWHSHALWALGTVALLAAGIAVLGYSRAAEADVRVPAYTETGVFSYTAPTSEDVYAGGAARTGDPVFVAATSRLDVTFGYQRSAGQLAGSVALVADVKSTTGWRRSFVVAPAQALRWRRHDHRRQPRPSPYPHRPRPARGADGRDRSAVRRPCSRRRAAARADGWDECACDLAARLPLPARRDDDEAR